MGKKQTISGAVQQALGTTQTPAILNAKQAALLAFATAVSAFIDADALAQSLAGSEWEQYIRAHCAGATSQELREAASECAEYEEEDKAAKNRCSQYAYRVRTLTDAGVPLMAGRRLNEPVMVDGAQVADTLGGYAQQLAKGKAKDKRAPRTTEGDGKAVAPVAPAPTTEDPAALVERVGALLSADGSDKLRAALIEACPDAIMAMAGIIAKARLEAAMAAEAAKAKTKARDKASAGERDEARRAARATMKRTERVTARAQEVTL